MRTLTFVLLLSACGSDSPAAPAPEAAPADAPVAPTVDAPVATKSTNPDAPRVPARTKDRVAASHILIAYAEAMKAPPEITRTREEARALADDVRKQAIAPGADFAALAKKYSDDSTAARGGSLGAFGTGKMVKPFEDAVTALQPGEIGAVVETPFGFHVIRRDELVEVHCAQLMVGFSGSEKSLPGVTRGKEDARARAEAAKKELEGGADWGTVVRKYSDGPLGDDAGDLGWFGRHQLMPQLDDPAFDLDIGGTSAVLESPVGFHVLKRLD